mgnify:CR=1 FL=1
MRSTHARPVLLAAALAAAGIAAGVAFKSAHADDEKWTSKPSFRKGVLVVEAPSGDLPLKVDIAESNRQRAYGMMFRERVAEDEGMIFLFDDDGVKTFWMKNTITPLDMIFIGRDWKVVGVYADAKPHSLERMTVGKPSRYVLEVRAGWAKAHGVTAGTRVRFTNTQN